METNTMLDDQLSITVQECQDIVNGYTQRETGTEDIDYIVEKGGVPWLITGLKTDIQNGFDAATIPARTEKYTDNHKPIIVAKTWWYFAWDALKDFLLRALLVAGVASIILETSMNAEHRQIAWIEGFAILLAVFVITVVTATNNLKKEKEFLNLNEQAESGKTITIIRNGERMEDVSFEECLVGDIVLVKSGMENPADAVLVEGFSIKMDESSVTGESKAMTKLTLSECLAKKQQAFAKLGGDRLAAHEVASPVILAGTKVVDGTGRMLILNVGKYSAIGKIKEIVDSGEDELTPLQMKLEKIARDISFFGFIAAVILFVVLIIRWIVEQSLNNKVAYNDNGLPILNSDGFATNTNGWKSNRAGDQAIYVLQALLMGITVLVVAIPEGLPLAVTLALAFSVGKMMDEKNLVRKLEACETMGGANIICSDKTGTLTKNEMYFTHFWCGGEHQVYDSVKSQNLPFDQYLHPQTQELLMHTIALNSLEDPDAKKGNPTEMALLKFLSGSGVDVLGLRGQFKIYFQATFSSDRKRMSTIIEMPDGKHIAFVKGASEYIIATADNFHNLETNQIIPITFEMRQQMEKAIESFANRALRTIGIAYKVVDPSRGPLDNPDDHGIHEYEKGGFNLVGICGIKDVIRPEVPASIVKCHRAGIDVKMVTGDNKITATAIAREVGIITAENEKRAIIMEGPEFLRQIGGVICENCRGNEKCDCVKNEDELKTPGNEDKKVVRHGIKNKEAFNLIWKDLCVLARSRPEDKYALVTGLKELENVVAVTGDGTNDAPALSKANVGFAMNIAGTEVAKHAADILLMDDNFASIVVAVKWGRSIYASIQKFLQLQLTVSLVSVIITLISAVGLQQAVLSSVQMLWINLVMDTLAALALATEPPSEELLERKPINKNDHIITLTMIKQIVGQTIFQLAVLIVFVFAGEKFLFDLNNRQTQPNSILIYNGFKQLGWNENLSSRFNSDFTVHAAYNFHVFMTMTWFNFFNCRILDDRVNIFHRIHKSNYYLIIMASIVVLQLIFVTFGGPAIRVAQWGLGPASWALCVGFGLMTWVIRFFLIFIKTEDSHIGFGNRKVTREELNRASLISIKRSHNSEFYNQHSVRRQSVIRNEGGSMRRPSQMAAKLVAESAQNPNVQIDHKRV